VSEDIPELVADDEPLHRRIHPFFRKPDGRVSSQAFTDPEMSVDRGRYWSAGQTLHGCNGHAVAMVVTFFARGLQQEVVADPVLLNPAHALVKGKKSKSIAKSFARMAQWVVRFDGDNAATAEESA
jgi:hypothetical protein